MSKPSGSVSGSDVSEDGTVARGSNVRTTVAVVGGVAAVLAGCAGPDGDVATWELRSPVDESSRSLDVLVTRLGCASGVTGDVLAPRVEYEDDRIVVIIDVERFTEGAADCQDNDAVPDVVELDEPVGDREVVDGACLDGEATGTAPCSDPVRWP